MEKTQSEALRDHIDRFCGEEPNEILKEESLNISVARFNDVPDLGLTTYISIGLSGHSLHQVSGTSIRQELLMTVDNAFAEFAIEEVIFSVAKLMITGHEAVARGQVLGPKGLLFPEQGSNLTCLLCSYPAFFAEDFSTFECHDTTVFVELLPTLTCEAQYIEQEGWSKFFDLIDEGAVNTLNYSR